MADASDWRIMIGAAFATDVNAKIAKIDKAKDVSDENILLCCEKGVA